jgi:hypothetical protein
MKSSQLISLHTQGNMLNMIIDDFLWLPDIVEKLYVKHRVTQEEVEDSFLASHISGL